MRLAQLTYLFGATCLAAATLLCNTQVSATAVWPQFRGPNCAGVSESDKPPVEFGPTNNLLWKIELPPGVSSPCIWEDRIFLTTFENQKLETLCIARRDGKILWRKSAAAEKIEEFNPTGSPTSGTPATDGKLVYVYFGSCGVVAYDFEGDEKWRMPLPIVNSLNGSGTSPALMDGLLIINRDQEEGRSSLLAIDARTGRKAWEMGRPDFASSYSTPVLWSRGDVREVVVAGSLRVVGYALADGSERWSAGGLEAVSVCPTPVIGDGQLFVASRSFGGATPPPFDKVVAEMDKNKDQKIAPDEGKNMLAAKSVFNAIDTDKDSFVTEDEWKVSMARIAKGEHGLFALRAPGSGDLTSTHVTWKQKRGIATVPSPLFYAGRVYLGQDGGRVTCYAASNGDALYQQERLGADGDYYASPIAADGKIYLCSTRGTISVIEAAETLKVLARNALGERVIATPAIADNKLYVRSANHLWAFGKKRRAAAH